MENNSHVKIILRELELNLRIGLYAHEQEGGKSQRIIVNVELYVPVSYLRAVDESKLVDYGALRERIKEWEQRDHTLLIETYVNDVLALCFEDARVEAARVSVVKPDIFADVERAGVEVFMHRADWQKQGA
jgi:dihydroneopterin aldolase